MKKGDHISDEQKAKMQAGRTAYFTKRAAEKAELDAKKAEHPEVVAKVDAGKVALQPGASMLATSTTATPPTANGHTNLLDIHDPLKWQMKVRLFLEASEPEAAETWLDGLRLISQMAGVLVRDAIYRTVTARCFICNKPFGRLPTAIAGEAGYYDAERQYIKVYCCHNAEYSKLLEKCQEKERAVAAWTERADKAAKQAESDARASARKEMPV